jgi:hypothetical protein
MPELIAGWKTPADWAALKTRLIVGQPERWQEAFETFFVARLDLRYLQPIKVLQENGTFSGEGFSIAAIQCSIIEFLEATLEGKRYRYTRDPRTLGPFEYSSSSEIFERFLSQRAPFSTHFSASLAHDFYIGVRCGLLHEARTKNGWLIHAQDPAQRLIDPARKIVFRDHFQTGLLAFVGDYGRALPTNPDYQEAFIRTFDHLTS